jgi:hypothetical protein
MLDVKAPPTTRIRAAQTVLQLASEFIDREDIEVRVRRLEQAEEASRHLDNRDVA